MRFFHVRFSLLGVATMVHKQIERMKRKLSEIELENAQYKARLEDGVKHAEEQRRTIQNKLLVIEALEKRFSEREEAHIATQIRIQSLEEERTVLQSRNTALTQSLNASQEENTNLCEECAEISDKNATLIKEEHSRKQEVRNAKRSVLRSFNWREKNVDAAVLRGAVAFWGATKAPGHEQNGENKRISCRARKQILKVIIEQGFNGELHDELEKEFMDKIRFKVFTLAKKSDLESKFNSEAIGSIAHCQPGHEKHMRGIIPSATTVNNFLQVMNAKAAELGLSCMPQTNTWCWGDNEGNKLREGVHKYIKALYYDQWDTRVTEDDPYIVVLTGDLARVSLSGKAVTLCGAKECDRRLKSQKDTTHNKWQGHQNNMNQSRNLYTPAMGGYETESDIMPLFEQLVALFVEVEKQQFIIVDNKRYDNVFIKILVVADMMFLHKFMEHGGCSAQTTHFCMFCSAMSKFRHEGQPGGCAKCRRAGKVYDTNGFQICLHHDVLSPQERQRQQQRHSYLQRLLSGKFPPRKKPIWGDKADLLLACIDRCVPGHTNLDGRVAYNPRDLENIPKWTISQCNAWLDKRCSGAASQ